MGNTSEEKLAALMVMAETAGKINSAKDTLTNIAQTAYQIQNSEKGSLPEGDDPEVVIQQLRETYAELRDEIKTATTEWVRIMNKHDAVLEKVVDKMIADIDEKDFDHEHNE